MPITNNEHKIQQNIDADAIDLAALLGVLIDGKWIFILVVCFSFFIGMSVAYISTPMYKTDALIQVEKKKNSFSVPGELGEFISPTASSKAEIALISSRSNLLKTIDKFHLTLLVSQQYDSFLDDLYDRVLKNKAIVNIEVFNLPYYSDHTEFMLRFIDENNYVLLTSNDEIILQGQSEQLIENNGNKIQLSYSNIEKNDMFFLKRISSFDAILKLRSDLTISEQGGDTGVLNLSLEGTDPDKNKRILNSIITDFLNQNIDRHSEEAEKSLIFLKDKIPEMRKALDLSEQKLNNYRQENDSVDLGLEAKSVLDLMIQIESELNDVELKMFEIQRNFTPKHPAYIEVENKKSLLLREKEKLVNQTKNLPQKQQEILRLMRDVEVSQQIYVQLLNRSQELEILKAATVGNIRIIDYAVKNILPIKPKKSLIVILSVLLGSIVGIGIILVRAAFNKGVDNPKDVEALNIPVLTCIPKSALQTNIKRSNVDHAYLPARMQLLSETDPEDLAIEAMRSLRTNLHFTLKKANNNIIMVSSPSPGVGKSFIAANLANTFVKMGKSVLVIDADLRKGTIHKYFGLNADVGLSEYLHEKIDRVKLIKITGIDGLDVITRGQVYSQPSEMLSSDNFYSLLAYLSEQYDHIIIDSPPVLAVTDPSIIGAYAGISLLVGRFEKTTLNEIELARNIFLKDGIHINGFILNFIEKKAKLKNSQYAYYRYEYK